MAENRRSFLVADPDEDDDIDVDEAPEHGAYRESFAAQQEYRLAILSERYDNGLDFWTGEPLESKERSELREVRDSHCGGNAPRKKARS